MMQFNPFLIVNRLIVTQKQHIAYDEKFHQGVNIIRGKNSSGKSTIADFIFYALGGELSEWKKEASMCTHTYIEVNLSGSIFTLRREIRDTSKAGMDIIHYPYEIAKLKEIIEWLRYPYSATDTKESFYQAILKELGIPYTKSDNSNSITLHQLLRLMYVDQMTSLDRLFKFDKFDNANKRKAIGELLIGLSDLKLYEERVRLQKLDKELTKTVDDISTLHRFFGSEIKTSNEIDEQINERNTLLSTLHEKLATVHQNESENKEDQNTKNLRSDIDDLRVGIREAQNKKLSLSFEITDSERFIKSLISRIDSLKDSSRTINALSNIGFKYCPSCFKPNNKNLINHCNLCGEETPKSDEPHDPTFKIRKEIEFQLAESNTIIALRQKELIEIESNLQSLVSTLESKKRTLEFIEKPIKLINQESREILINIGTTTKEIEQLIQSKSNFSQLYDLYNKRDVIQAEFNKAKSLVELLESKLHFEMNKKKAMISKCTLSIIKADLNHEEAFKDAKNIEFDFGEDRVSIDNRVLFSASSMVFLKNSFRLALLKASCLDNSFLYPRFLLMDNVEDKGMEPERSHTFQNEIIRASNELTVAHQIIFTTSMIDEMLNDSIYCVGEFYTDENKSLKLL